MLILLSVSIGVVDSSGWNYSVVSIQAANIQLVDILAVVVYYKVAAAANSVVPKELLIMMLILMLMQMDLVEFA